MLIRQLEKIGGHRKAGVSMSPLRRKPDPALEAPTYPLRDLLFAYTAGWVLTHKYILLGLMSSILWMGKGHRFLGSILLVLTAVISWGRMIINFSGQKGKINRLFFIRENKTGYLAQSTVPIMIPQE